MLAHYRKGYGTMSDEAVKITVLANGPLRVEGPVALADAAGNYWDLAEKPTIFLCRCGQSEKRPFCDGAHKRVGFEDAATPTAEND